MGYKQVDGNKNILVNERGQLRHGLRNLPPDSDRIIYERNKDGSVANEWPKVVVDVNQGGKEDVRLLPELVMKEHGELPRSLSCAKGDFKSKSGSKHNITDCALENIEYVGSGSAKAQKPYKDAPEKEKDTGAEAKAAPEPPESKKVEAAEKAQAADTPKVKTEGEMSDLAKGSGELNAKEAIKIINNYDFEELQDLGFYTEEERDGDVRVTVQEAWEKKKKEYEGG